MVRLAHAAKEKGININFFNYLDGTVIGHREQAPKEFPVVEQLFGTVLKKGLKNSKTDAIACIKCTEARGVTKQQTEGVVIGGLYDLAEWTAESDKTIYWGEKMSKKVNIIVTQHPYGKEDAYSAIPLAETQAAAGSLPSITFVS